MKIAYALLILQLSFSVFAQGRPGQAGGASSGANTPIDDVVIEEFKKLAKQCHNQEFGGIDLRQIHEFLSAKELSDKLKEHDHEDCEKYSPAGEHITPSLDCYLTDKFRSSMREFLKHSNSLKAIQEARVVTGKKNNGMAKTRKLSKDEAKVVWDYFDQLVADKQSPTKVKP